MQCVSLNITICLRYVTHNLLFLSLFPHSVLRKSPPNLLTEIILVDDFSDDRKYCFICFLEQLTPINVCAWVCLFALFHMYRSEANLALLELGLGQQVPTQGLILGGGFSLMHASQMGVLSVTQLLLTEFKFDSEGPGSRLGSYEEPDRVDRE